MEQTENNFREYDSLTVGDYFELWVLRPSDDKRRLLEAVRGLPNLPPEVSGLLRVSLDVDKAP